VRTGLLVILSFFDREPELARFCVVQSARDGQRVLEWREKLLSRLADVVYEGSAHGGAREAQVPALTAEGSVGAVVAILNRRLSSTEREPLVGLLGSLMSLIVLPYRGTAAARSEHTRRAASPVGTAAPSALPQKGAYSHGQDPLRDLSMRLTYRTARVLQAAAEHPGESNRAIGEAADIHDQGQISKLLARLEGLGLIENTSGNGHRPTGAPNAWRLTPHGEEVERAVGIGAPNANTTEGRCSPLIPGGE
jgi:DNA-binding MarR family transcriptional regulator